MHRIFLAVFPPPGVQRAAFEMEERLRRPGDRVSWVKRENLHYTLRFIGEVGEDGVRRIEEAAREAAAGQRPFDAALGHAGAFPSPRRARVLWIAMALGAEPLVAVARDLETALARRGFAKESRPFSPHLTIGRLREPGPDWTDRLAAAHAPDPAPRFRVERISVVESQLSPKGSIYTVRLDAEFSP